METPSTPTAMVISMLHKLSITRKQQAENLFIESASALAYVLWEPTAIDIVQLSNCPAIHMIFRDFAKGWLPYPGVNITSNAAREAVAIFRDSLDIPRPWKVSSGSNLAQWCGIEVHIANFMLRCRDWIKLQQPPFSMPSQVKRLTAPPVLFGILGVCILVYESGAFPDGPLDVDASILESLDTWQQECSSNAATRTNPDSKYYLQVPGGLVGPPAILPQLRLRFDRIPNEMH
ncbi:hypothetical protein F5X99DRAFT_427856 [Biscogniauxia marginata]|nr:hypothetical protein F5X99DRAFT_427856 [Biscogniauxia marginata]